MIQFDCPYCGQSLCHPDAGGEVACPYCNGVFPVWRPQQPTVRCFRCGRFYPANQTVRREMETGRTRSIHGSANPFDSIPILGGMNTPVIGGMSVSTGLVDLCRPCARRLEAEHQQRNRTILTVTLCLIAFFALIFGSCLLSMLFPQGH